MYLNPLYCRNITACSHVLLLSKLRNFCDACVYIRQDRWIVVREVDGTLREASWNERDRMCQLFFPKLGRKMNLPQMLQRHQLPEVLSLNHHPLVLDVANVQCEPDSKEYIRVRARSTPPPLSLFYTPQLVAFSALGSQDSVQ